MVVLHVLAVALLGPDRPHVVLGRVVEHEVQHQRDARLPQVRRQRAQVVDRAEPGIHRPVVADGIAAVAVAGPRGEQRHQVQIGQPQPLQIGNLLPQPRQIPRKQVHVQRAPGHPLGQMPPRIVLAPQIQLVQVVRPLQPAVHRRQRNAFQIVEEVVVASVEPVQQAEEARPVLRQPRLDRFHPPLRPEARIARLLDAPENPGPDAPQRPLRFVGCVEFRHGAPPGRTPSRCSRSRCRRGSRSRSPPCPDPSARRSGS